MKRKIAFIFITLFFFNALQEARAADCPKYTINYFVDCGGDDIGNNEVLLSAINSGGPTDNSYTWTWDFGDGSPVATNTGSQPYTRWHTYVLAGNYTASLTYSGGSCSPVTTSLLMDVYKVTVNLLVTPNPVLRDMPVSVRVITTPSHPRLSSYALTISNLGTFSVTPEKPFVFYPLYETTYSLDLEAWHIEWCYMHAYANFNSVCPTCAVTGITASSPACVGNAVHFTNNIANCTALGSGGTDQLQYVWDYGDGTTSIGYNPDHVYTSPGTYTVKVTYQFLGSGNTSQQPGGSQLVAIEAPSYCGVLPGGSTTVTVTACVPPPCEQCVGSFAPTPGTYILGTWVKQSSGQNLLTYDKAGVKLICLTPQGPQVSGPFYPSPSEKIIDGWQRIEQKFTVPINTSQIKIQLVNSGSTDAYYDDIRIHPVDGNMKSFVYDPVTLRLMAELDANNFATFYEYNEKGEVIRVKKETERGIVTIKESRNNNSK